MLRQILIADGEDRILCSLIVLSLLLHSQLCYLLRHVKAIRSLRLNKMDLWKAENFSATLCRDTGETRAVHRICDGTAHAVLRAWPSRTINFMPSGIRIFFVCFPSHTTVCASTELALFVYFAIIGFGTLGGFLSGRSGSQMSISRLPQTLPSTSCASENSPRELN